LSDPDIASPTSSVTVTTTYVLTVNRNLGVECKDTVIVTVNQSPTANFSIVNDGVCGNTPIGFSNLSSGTALNYLWDFDDSGSSSNTSTALNPSHLFTSFGNNTEEYQVSLTVTDVNNCTSTVTKAVTIKQIPDAAVFDYEDNKPFVNCGEITFPLTIDNTSSTITTNTNYSINWGDGNSELLTSDWLQANHTYPSYGYFNLVNTVTGQNGCVGSKTFSVYNGSNPAVGIGNPGNTVSLCVPHSLTFPITGTANNPPGTIYIVSTNTNSPPVTFTHPPPASYTHVFTNSSCGATGANNANSFYVRIRAENPCGFSESTVEPITTSIKPVADFTISPDTIICKNTTVSFNNTSINGIEVDNGACILTTKNRWLISPSVGWSVSSGSLGSPNPNLNPNTWGSVTLNVNFTEPGIYSISMIVGNNCGNDTLTRQICVEVPPIPNFTINPSSGCVPFNVNTDNTTDLSDICKIDHNWAISLSSNTCSASAGTTIFVNGTSASSFEPIVRISSPGVYAIVLSETNKCGTFTQTKTITAQDKPVVNVSSLSPICLGQSATPSANVNDCYEPSNSYSWTFENGSPTTSSSLNPGSIAFNTSGSLDVTLSATNNCGTDSETTQITVNSLPPELNPTVNAQICVGGDIELESDLLNNITYSWSGPNGFSSNLQNPVLSNVTTANAGSYSVFPTAGVCPGPTESINVVVNSLPVVSAPVVSDICLNAPSVTIVGSPAGGTWSGTGISSTGVFNPLTAGVGTHTLTYSFTNSTTNCTNTTQTSVTVKPLPTPNAGTDVQLCNQAIPFTLSGTPADGTWSGSTNVTAAGVFTPNGIGDFNLIYTVNGANSCVNKDTVKINVINPTTANAGSNVSICVDAANIQLSGTPPSGTWSGTGVTSAGIFDPTTDGTFNLTYSTGSGTCLSTDVMAVTVNPLPVVNAPIDFDICLNSPSTTVVGSPAGGTWTGTGITSAGVFNPLTAGVGPQTLTYSFTNATTNCTNTDQITITVKPLPTPNAGSDVQLCNQPIPFNLSGIPVTGTWSGSMNVTAAGVFTPNGTGTFNLIYTITGANSCVNKDTVEISVINPTTANAGSNVAICVDAANIQLTGIPITGTWSGTGVSSAGIFDPTTDGTFNLTFSTGSGTCLSTDVMSVTVNPLPVISVPDDFSICLNGGDTLLSASPVNGTWVGTGMVNGVFSPSTAGQGTHIINYSFQDPITGCVNSENVTILVHGLPAVNAGNDLTLCNQPIAEILVPVTPSNGTWSGTNILNGAFTPNGTGTFSILYTFTDANSCTNKDSIQITVGNPDDPDAGNDTIVCIDASNFQLSGLPINGTWSGTGVSSTGVFDPTSEGVFTLTFSTGGGTCLSSDQMTVTVNSLPTVTAQVDFSTCLNSENTNLSATPLGGTWTGIGIVSNGVFSPSAAGQGTYVLTYTYIDPVTNCSSFDIVSATVHTIPTVNAGNDLLICNQPIAEVLSATPTGGSWSGTGITNPSGEFTPNGIGNFEIVYSFTDGNSCTNKDTIQIEVADPQISDAGADLSVCIDAANVQLTGSPSPGTWSGIGVTSSGIFDPFTANNFELVYSIGSGTCLNRDTLILTVNPLPIVNAQADFEICLNEASVNLTANPINGIWSGNGVGATEIFDPLSAGEGAHTLTYTFVDANSCSNFDEVEVVVHGLPTVDAGNDITLCNQPIDEILVPNTPLNGTWSGQNVSNGAFTPSGTGTFTITYTFTDNNSCTNKDSILVQVNNPIIAVAGIDTIVCIDAPNIVLASVINPDNWSGTGVTSAGVFDPIAAGDFVLTLTIGSGTCLSTDNMLVTVNPLPIVVAQQDVEICLNAGTINLTALPLNGTWTGNGVNSTGTFDPLIATAGIHTLRYTFIDPITDCSNFDEIQVEVFALPIIDAGQDFQVCNQPIAVDLVASPAGGTWSGNGVSDPNGEYLPFQTGDFELVYSFTDLNQCNNKDTVIVSVVEPQLANAGADTAVCHFTQLLPLVGSPNNGDWSGINVTTQGIFSPIQVDDFFLVYSFGAGNCLNHDTVKITVHPLPIVQVGNDRIFCENDNIETFIPSPLGGNWQGQGITDNLNGTFDPSLPPNDSQFYPIIYFFTDTNSCLNSDTLQVRINPIPVIDFTFDTVICKNTATLFTTTIQNGGTYFWDFGDGSSINNEQTPTHTFTDIGFYTIKLRVVSPFSCTDSLSQIIQVIEPANPDFTLTPDSSCGPSIVSFTNLSSALDNFSSSWDFGNGETSNLSQPNSVTYLASIIKDTVYFATLSITNLCGTVDKLDSIKVMPTPKVIFGTNVDIGCSPITIEIANNSVGLADNYFWDFGDGQQSTDTSALLAHVFTTGINDTIYTITLIATNECGSDTSSHQITVLPNTVNAFFNTPIISGCEPLTINFTQFSTGANNSNWDFGDGNLSSTLNPTHTFVNEGSYTINLFVDNGCSFDTATVTITVHPKPVADFEFGSILICNPDSLNFINNSTHVGDVLWNFGDGDTSNYYNPTHFYTASGNYNVSLLVSSNNGCKDTIVKSLEIQQSPIASFTLPQSICQDELFTIGNSSQFFDFVNFDFGNGTSSNNQTPNLSFDEPGIFNISMALENLQGCFDTISQAILVNPKPLVDFSIETQNICFPDSIILTNNSTLTENVLWTFGDGTSSINFIESHSFTAIGTYDIKLVGIGLNSTCADSITRTVTVNPTPFASFTLPQTICQDELFTIGNSSQFFDFVNFDFGNGTSSNNQTPSLSFDEPGIFNISMALENLQGCFDTISQAILVNPKPLVDFSIESQNICFPDSIILTNNSTLTENVLWTFGDGTSSINFIESHSFAAIGSYDIKLVGTGINSVCKDSITRTVTVNPTPIASFTLPQTICQDELFTIGNSSQFYDFVNFDFGNGNSSNNQTPSLSFDEPGIFNISMALENIQGCFDTISQAILVYPKPVADFSIAPYDSCNLPVNVNFINNSLGAVDYSWDFNNGSISEITNPNTIFSSAGNYSVNLIVANQYQCSDTLIKQLLISPVPIADFTISPYDSCSPSIVTFSNLSLNSNFNSWIFGDGNTSTLLNPANIYQNNGSFTVKLIVESLNGCKDSLSKNLITYPSPIADFDIINLDSCELPSQVFLNNLSSGALLYDWNMGNGMNSNLTHPSVFYNDAGTYFVKLVAENEYGCTDEKIKELNVHLAPIANLVIGDPELCTYESLIATSLSTLSDSVKWFMGDGTSLSGNVINHQYDSPGNYTITIVAYGQGTCTDTLVASQNITIFDTPIANFSYLNTEFDNTNNGTVEFQNLSSLATNYLWFFPNDSISTLINPSYNFENFGTEIIQLVALNDNGCSDTMVKPVKIEYFNGLFVANAMYPGHSEFEVSNFLPKGVGLLTYNIKIYDDWGNLLWESSALDDYGRPTEAWDGTFKGVPVQQDAYVWKVDATYYNEGLWEGKLYPNGKIKRSGTVTVIR
jgi:PKD repeat protein